MAINPWVTLDSEALGVIGSTENTGAWCTESGLGIEPKVPVDEDIVNSSQLSVCN